GHAAGGSRDRERRWPPCFPARSRADPSFRELGALAIAHSSLRVCRPCRRVRPRGCSPPAGKFACGSTFCTKDTERCDELRTDTEEEPHPYSCLPKPQRVGA